MKTYALAIARNIILCLVLVVCLTACFGDWSIPTEIHVNSLSDAEKKLADYNFASVGLSPDNPLDVFVKFDIGDLSQPNNDYLRLIEIIGKYGLYVYLRHGENKMGGTTMFTSPPLDKAIKGMEKIINIVLPIATTSIMADKNGRSPFFFYENLISVGASVFTPKITEIGDYAFSSCKKLEGAKWGSVKTVGREAFRGCEELKHILFDFSLETIGESAFFDCSSLGKVRMKGKPPTLDDSVFLGSTPSTLTFYIEQEHEMVYRAWLAENASKFNNNGEDIILDFSSIY